MRIGTSVAKPSLTARRAAVRPHFTPTEIVDKAVLVSVVSAPGAAAGGVVGAGLGFVTGLLFGLRGAAVGATAMGVLGAAVGGYLSFTIARMD